MSFSSTGDSEINSGLIVIGETVVTLHKETTEKVKYNITTVQWCDVITVTRSGRQLDMVYLVLQQMKIILQSALPA